MLYLNGHNYKYAAEQMLLSLRDGTSRGGPGSFSSSGQMNCPCGKVLASGQNAWSAPNGAGVSSICTWRSL